MPAPSRDPTETGEEPAGRPEDAYVHRTLRARLFEKAASLTTDRDDLRYAIRARESITHKTSDILAVTAADVFAGTGG